MAVDCTNKLKLISNEFHFSFIQYKHGRTIEHTEIMTSVFFFLMLTMALKKKTQCFPRTYFLKYCGSRSFPAQQSITFFFLLA